MDKEETLKWIIDGGEKIKMKVEDSSPRVVTTLLKKNRDPGVVEN